MLNPVAVAIPVFFALIGVEAAYSWWKGLRVYRLNDALTDLGCGVTDQVGAVFLEGVLLAAYLWTYEHARALTLPDSVAVFVAANVGVDLSYYLWHRASHRVNFIWATHVVHHQSDEYNLAVALRQAVFAGLTSWPFYLWLAVLGVSPGIYAGAKAFNLLYQFWIHTRVVGKLGPVELVMNTPSHHRVHHGVNRAYIDKNYAGVLIVWDRLFGTFEPEVEPVTYGTVTQFRSWNPVWAQVDHWSRLWQVAAAAPRPIDKLKVWFMPPEWVPEGMAAHDFPPDEVLAARPKYDVDAPGWHRYAVLQWVPIAATVTGLLLFAHDAPAVALAPVAMWVLTSLVALAGLFEGRSWALGLEVARLLGLIALGAVAAAAVHPVGAALIAWALASLAAAALTATRAASPPSSPAAAA